MRLSVRTVIAAAVALTMCIVPLICTDGSDSAVLTPGDKAASFSATDVGDDDFNNLFSDQYKLGLAYMTLEAIDTEVTHYESGDYVYDYEITELEITNVAEIKSAVGRKVTETGLCDTNVKEIRCDISFTATRINCDGILFTMRDGMQTLYKELDNGNIITVGSFLKLKGELWLDDLDSVEKTIVKNEVSDYVVTGSTQKLSNFRGFMGDFDYTYTYNDDAVNKKYAAVCEFSYGGTVVTNVDYLDASPEKVNVFSKAIRTLDHSDSAYRYSYRYHVGDVASGYDYRLGADGLSKLIDRQVSAGTAGELDLVITGDILVPDYYFYKEDGEMSANCLYNASAIKDATCKTDAAMKERLDKLGDVGIEYDDAKSVAESAYNELILNPVLRVDGLAAIVTIAVLVTAVVVLGIIMIKKK